MSVLNRTPFPALAFRQITPSGDLVGVAVLRGTFRIGADGTLEPEAEQPPLQLVDRYAGDPLSSPLLVPGDLIPYRPATDVTILGSAHAPGGRPLSRWSCGVILGPVAARLAVCGPRDWVASWETESWLRDPLRRRRRKRWSLSEPLAVTEVALDWALAWGGPLPSRSDEAAAVVTANPSGRGARPDLLPEMVDRWPAPQIEAEDHPLAEPDRNYAPAGFAPIPPFWSVRQQHAGTYDAHWLNHRHPLLPKDFDMRFWNAAAPALQVRPWLDGRESFTLENLLPNCPSLSGRLPGIAFELALEGRGFRSHSRFVLDAVQFDLRAGRRAVSLVWRTSFPWPEREGLPEVRLAGHPARIAA